MIVYRIKQLAKPNGPVGRSVIYREIAAGRLVAHKIGGATVILEPDWRAFLQGAPLAGQSPQESSPRTDEPSA